MLVVISPAKRLDEKPGPEMAGTTRPEFQAEATQLAGVAAQLSPDALKRLMHISDSLASLNAARFAGFQADPAPEAVKPAVHLFDGDTYAGLDAASLDADALRFAQSHLRILSGLYGLLRPLDAIQPHRLEMGSRLATERGSCLYDFWGDRVAEALNRAAEAAGTDVLVNCASKEYFTAADRAALKPKVVTPVFFEERPSGPKIVSFYAKKARGAMARFIVEHGLTDPEALKEFDAGGYRFRPDVSDDSSLVFLRGSDAE
ncbi:peroxide stress protein YaaA [Rhodovulum sulfidophilum]|nr:peroxide stress protein YaaA [Rhodovulum sulfidophilum]